MAKVAEVKNVILSGNIPFIKGKPGCAKSASMKAIAEELGWMYIDVRLSQKDEVDVSGLPTFSDYKGRKMADYALPAWFVMAHEESEAGRGVLIHFEEINRTTLPVRNACLEILNERTLNNIQLNDNVHFVVSGNLGEEDNCEVDEMDFAVINRLVPLNFDMGFQQWKKDFGTANVHPLVMEFLDNNSTKFYDVSGNSNNGQGATPRSWTNLSEFIKYHSKGNEAIEPADVLKFLTDDIGKGFIGNTYIDFKSFLTQLVRYYLHDIYFSWGTKGSKIAKSRKSTKLDLCNQFNSLKAEDIRKLDAVARNNFMKFMETLDGEDMFGVFSKILRSADMADINNSFAKDVITRFQDLAKRFKAELKKSDNGK